MSEETGALARHRRELEDKELEVMELLEPVEQELEAIEGELSVLAGEREGAAAALAAAEAALDSELEKVHAERDTLATGLPIDLAATYERLRQRLGGIGAAKLVEGACGGCHLHLPTGERERLLHSAPGEVVYCDQCGRILVA
jgi:predicted  nucleic acid-binding Zn-ribbon protein